MDKVKHRNDDEKNYIKTRLKTIEGQVRGISQMIDDDRYCNDILIQISAINNSLKSLAQEILKIHMSTCIVDDIKKDRLEVIDEVMDLIKKVS